MNMLSDFEDLTSQTGIALPSLLKNLLSSGKTSYGPDWATTWQEKMLNGSPAFVSWYDFEWITATDAQQVIREWLNPQAQSGRVFLPFAQSGAGDIYCLMPIEEKSIGVALICHDFETSEIDHQSFDDFVISKFLNNFADLSHLSDDWSEDQVLQCVKSDVLNVSSLMDENQKNYLRSMAEQPLAHREFRSGPKARPTQVLSLISQEKLNHELASFPSPKLDPFKIVPRWEL
jgi:hypothetical protein